LTRRPATTGAMGEQHQVSIVSDGFADRLEGSTVTVRWVDIDPVAAAAAPEGLTNWEFFEGALLALGFRYEDGQVAVLGSAVMIAPGLALTATHVLRDLLPRLESGRVSMFALGVRPNDKLDYFSVRTLNYRDSSASDLCWLSLFLQSEPDVGWGFSLFPVTTRTPKVGHRVAVLGFRFPEAVMSPGAAASDLAPLKGNAYAAAGTVSEIYYPRRESVMAPFPAIEVQCGALHGMSGGPVIGDDGRLLGIASSAFDEDGPMIAAWVIEALVRPLDVGWPPGLWAPGTVPIDVRNGIVDIDRPDALEVVATGWRYSAWESASAPPSTEPK
jgi:hypothetical protein